MGALGILLALLSKRKKLCRQAKTAIVMCSVGMASFAIMFLISTALLVSTGTWDFMMEKIRGMDVNDPNAAAELQQEILDELVNRMGLTVDSGDQNAAKDSVTGWAESSGKEGTI